MTQLRGIFLSLLSLFLALPQARAQGVPALPEVGAVRVEFDGFQSVSDEYILGSIQLREGMEYNPGLVDRSIRSLYDTGLFEYVEVRLRDLDEGKVEVSFLVVPKYFISRVLFTGNEKYSESRLASKIELSAGAMLDEYAVSVAASAIRDYYVEKGFSEVAVDYRIEKDEVKGQSEVVFEIDEGGRTKIGKVVFEGNEAYSDRRLRKVMETKKHSIWLSWLTGSGRFDRAKFLEDLESVRAFYRDNGYLDVAIADEDVSLTYPKKGKLRIEVSVREGQRYFLGDLSVEGNTIFTNEELLDTVKIEPGEPFSPDALDEAANGVRDYYTSRGYLDARARAERRPNMDTRRIDIAFRVAESEKFYLESINIDGNTKTKTKVILRELALRPGDVFDLVRMETSQKRLENMGYFQPVNLSPETTNIPGRRDLRITLREAPTGEISFGAGFSSVENVVFFFEVSQGNFDLFNWRSGFQGDGQKFRIRGSLGTDSSQLLIAFEEPWLFEQRLAFGTEIFRIETDFNSSEYNELRTGFELYLRRRLFELVDGRLSYRLENVEIFDVARGTGPEQPDGSVPNDGVPDVIQAAEGDDLISKAGFSLLRDTRRSLLFTRRGNISSFATELAGGPFGGDVNYHKMELRTAQFIPTFDTLEQSFSVIARVGTVSPFGDSDDVPFYDRFYLGGPDSLRGFEFRDIGPRDDDDADEAVGGNTFALFSVEYLFRVAEPLGLVVFYDWGFVNEEDYDFSASDYADNWGVGVRLLLMGSPLKLDLGIPITTPDNVEDDGTQFNFSFGTRF